MVTNWKIFKYVLKVVFSYPIAFIIWAFTKDKRKTKYVAHRGYSALAPDSSEKSFTLATEYPFYGIETDIRFTKDNKIILSHDPEQSFKDGQTKEIDKYSYEELTSIELTRNAKLVGLDTYLGLCKKGDKHPVIELKCDFTLDDCKYILDEINKYYDVNKVTIISFFMNPLLSIRSINLSINLEYLVGAFEFDKVYLALDNNMDIDAHFTDLSFKMIKAYHKKGLKVNSWTINSGIIKRFAIFRNIDFITSNKYYK